MKASLIDLQANQPPVLIATGERSNVRVRNYRTSSSTNVVIYVGGDDMPTASIPQYAGVALNNSDEIEIYLEKNELLYAMATDVCMVEVMIYSPATK